VRAAAVRKEGIVLWTLIRCVLMTVVLLAHGRIHLPRGRVGLRLRFAGRDELLAKPQAVGGAMPAAVTDGLRLTRVEIAAA